MSDLMVVAVLVSLVVLVVLGQWLMNRRAGLARGPVPESLRKRCPEAVLVYFHSPRCRACGRMQPFISGLAESHPGRVCLIDISEVPEIARDARVIGTPTLMTITAGRIRDVRLGDVGPGTLERIASDLGLHESNTPC
ncbi:thioredoxin family protein [Guyparkeria sp.]|uniref:thioredoxin family protein n=1 Tax=Guyparkeria sp. TaxID=2035736 RepID=UPI003564DCAA